jgi:hypothetical protein
MVQPNLLTLARQGDEQAIATLIDESLRPHAIAAKVSLADGCLRIRIEGPQTPDQNAALGRLCRALLHLQLSIVKSVQVYARQQEQPCPVWSETFLANRRSLLKRLAKQGDEEAIAALLSRALSHQNVTVKAQLQDAHLQICLSSSQAPNPTVAVTLIQRELAGFSPDLIAEVQVLGQQSGANFPDWTEQFSRQGAIVKPSQATADLPPVQPTTVASPTPAPAQPTPQSLPTELPTEWTFKFNFLKLGFITLLALYGLFGASDYTIDGFLTGSNGIMMFMHGINLIFHEAGHVLFSPFGRFIYMLGGSLMQILVPAGICGYFFYTRQRYASAIALCWAGENFWDVSIYIKDAQDRVLPLLGGEISYHDWHYLLLQLNALAKAQPFGNFVYSLGILVYGFAIFAGVYYAQINRIKTEA